MDNLLSYQNSLLFFTHVLVTTVDQRVQNSSHGICQSQIARY